MNVTVCPGGTPPRPTTGCQGQLLPSGTLNLPAPCSAVALDACVAQTSTVFDATQVNNGATVSVVPAVPPTWSSDVTGRGYDVGLTNGTVRLVGFGGAPTKAVLGTPEGLAMGLDGSRYLAAPLLHRVRRIDPSGTITTVAGSGASCSSPTSACGDERRASHRRRHLGRCPPGRLQRAARRNRPATRRTPRPKRHRRHIWVRCHFWRHPSRRPTTTSPYPTSRLTGTGRSPSRSNCTGPGRWTCSRRPGAAISRGPSSVCHPAPRAAASPDTCGVGRGAGRGRWE